MRFLLVALAAAAALPAAAETVRVVDAKCTLPGSLLPRTCEVEQTLAPVAPSRPARVETGRVVATLPSGLRVVEVACQLPGSRLTRQCEIVVPPAGQIAQAR